MLIDDADTTLMVLYDTVRYTGRLLTVRVEYRAHTEAHAYRSPDPCQFEGHPSLHPTLSLTTLSSLRIPSSVFNYIQFHWIPQLNCFVFNRFHQSLISYHSPDF